jgi:oxygen-dependent protoporphyrinogen oxidase
LTHRVETVVIGAGISGLVCAHALQKAGVDVLVLEMTDRAGGSIRTESRDGYLLELGPQSFSGTPQMLELFDELGLEEQIVQAPAGAPRYVLVNGALRKVPMTPPAFLGSGFVGLGTKFAILRDLIGKSRPPDEDESIAAFVRRKFSAEMLDRLVGPFVSGIYAGDPERLSLRSAFPTLYDAEKRKGSVIRGMLSKPNSPGPKQSRQRPTLLSFRDGTETFVRALTAGLADRIQLGAEVTSVRTTGGEPGGASDATFSVTFRTAAGLQTIVGDHLIVATPTDVVAKLLRDFEPGFASSLSAIEYASMAVVSLGYAKADVGHSLNGFGFLVPRSAGIRTLGTVWNSSLFSRRAPNGNVLLTSFVGGATDPQAATLSPSELVAIVHEEIAPHLGIGKTPSFSKVTIYPRALPQYNLGHAARLAAVEQARARHSNLWLVGNYLRGPAIGACVEQALSVAEEIISRRTR